MGSFREIVEDDDHIELFEPELNALKRHNLDVVERDNQEWRVGEVDQAVRTRRNLDVGAIWYTIKPELLERNIKFNGFFGLKLE
jgi:hypothetical protein